MQQDSFFTRYKRLILIFSIVSVISCLTTAGIYKATTTDRKSTSAAIGLPAGQADREVADTNPAKPIIIGTSILTDFGWTSEDATAISAVVSDYLLTNTKYPPETVAEYKKAFCGKNDDDGFSPCSFEMSVNKEDRYYANARTNSLGSLHLTMRDTKGTIVYDKDVPPVTTN